MQHTPSTITPASTCGQLSLPRLPLCKTSLPLDQIDYEIPKTLLQEICQLLESAPQLCFDARTEAPLLQDISKRGAGELLLQRSFGAIAGIAIAGSYGVRGIVTHFWPPPGGLGSELSSIPLLQNVLHALRERGIRRLHVLVNDQNKSTLQFWRGLGFAECPGERLMQRHLIGIQPPQHPHPEIDIRRLRSADLDTLAELLPSVPELAFQPWELEVLRDGCEDSGRAYFVAEHAGQIVGALIGGTFGIRGTISHTWVSATCRGRGIGASLVEAALHQLRENNAKSVHLMLTPGNDAAYQFWSALGFQEIPGETFLELDI
ncbi:MAG: GNAT family N-acetyltransferase [Oligoflexia bacterium]|nr:GNAT family N-acetyltransferase [Oligoflexia bacterium]